MVDSEARLSVKKGLEVDCLEVKGQVLGCVPVTEWAAYGTESQDMRAPGLRFRYFRYADLFVKLLVITILPLQETWKLGNSKFFGSTVLYKSSKPNAKGRLG
jgi:hypothetical protein